MTAIVVNVDGQNVDLALDWAKEHCSSYITNTGKIEGAWSDDTGYRSARIVYEFHFYDEHDAAMFALKWS
jgi:hypothetical protein